MYVGHKMKVANELGFKAEHVKLAASCTESEILATIEKLNEDNSIHGIIVQVMFIDHCNCTSVAAVEIILNQ